MVRKRVSKGAVIIKKDEKLRHIFQIIGENATLDEFKSIFKKIYLKDWERIQKKYDEHVKLNRGKRIPMPAPEKYLEMTYNNYKNKCKKEI